MSRSGRIFMIKTHIETLDRQSPGTFIDGWEVATLLSHLVQGTSESLSVMIKMLELKLKILAQRGQLIQMLLEEVKTLEGVE